MMPFNKKHIIIFLFAYCVQSILFAQVGTYTKVNKIYRDTYNFLKNADIDSKQCKDKSLYIVYSDRDLNNSYLDPLGLNQGKQQQFLTPYFVINEKTDYLELVKFDPTVIGNPKGIFSFFYGDKYNFKDTKNIEYVGWIQKGKLLHFSHPKVSEFNLKPIVYYLGINNTETLLNLKKYIKKDSITAFKDPNLKIKSKKAFNTNQFVYLYKYNTNKTAALVSNLQHIHEEDSLKRVMGWVPSQLIKNIGQRKVWKVDKEDEVLYDNKDSLEYVVKGIDINSYIFRSIEKPKTKEDLLDSLSLKVVHTPINVWDHYNNKLINIKGGDIYLREIPTIKKQKNVFNLHLVFDCSTNLRSKLTQQISSLQRIWLLISDNDLYKNYTFTFSASSFGCNNYYTFPKSNSFALWIDYLQKVFSNNASIITTESNIEGIQKNLKEIINGEKTKKSFENNIILILGNENLSLLTKNNRLMQDLANISAQFIFFQLENKAGNSHQDYVLKAKQILDQMGKEYYNFITDYIIESELDIKQNAFKTIESEDNNIYIYDTPIHSLYNGGIVFPKVNKSLSSTSFDIAIDSTLDNTIKSNTAFITSLEDGDDKLGFLRSKATKRIRDIIKKNSTINQSISILKNQKRERYLETSKLKITNNMELESGYMFSKKELEIIIESYKSIIPLIGNNVENKHRRILYCKYKSYYKQLNNLLFYKKLKKKNTVGELIEIKTGIKVGDSVLNTIKIKEIKKKKQLSNQQFLEVMKSLRTKINTLERIIENPATNIYLDGSKTLYYYVPENKLL